LVRSYQHSANLSLDRGSAMPAKRRDILIRQHDQTQAALDKSLYYLGEMKTMYGEEKPQHADAVSAIAIMIVNTKDFLRQFRINFM